MELKTGAVYGGAQILDEKQEEIMNVLDIQMRRMRCEKGEQNLGTSSGVFCEIDELIFRVCRIFQFLPPTINDSTDQKRPMLLHSSGNELGPLNHIAD